MNVLKLLPVLFFIAISSAQGKTAEDCRGDVERAVQSAGSDGRDMMRAGDKALERCLSQKTERSKGSVIAWIVLILIVGVIIVGVLSKGNKEKDEDKSSEKERLKASAENEIRKEKLKSEKRGWLSFEDIEKKESDIPQTGTVADKCNIEMQDYSKISQEEIEEINNQGGINQVDDYGNTLLFYACYYSNYSIFKQLIELGANVSVTNNLNDTPLHYMMYMGNFQDDTLKIMQGLFDNHLILDGSMMHVEDAVMVGLRFQIDYAWGENLDDIKEYCTDEILKIIKVLKANNIPVNDKPINEYLEHISTHEFKINEVCADISKACN